MINYREAEGFVNGNFRRTAREQELPVTLPVFFKIDTQIIHFFTKSVILCTQVLESAAKNKGFSDKEVEAFVLDLSKLSRG